MSSFGRICAKVCHNSRRKVHDGSRKRRANYPHKLTKTAEPWLGGGAASGGSNCTPASRRLPVRSCHCVLVAAAAALLFWGRHGERLLQLRVSALGALRELRTITRRSIAIHASHLGAESRLMARPRPKSQRKSKVSAAG